MPTDIKDAVNDLGKDVAKRVDKEEIADFWNDVTKAVRKSPGLTLSLAAGGGLIAGFFVSRALTSAAQSPAEKKVKDWIGTAQDSWCQMRDGLGAIKEAIQRINK